MGVERHVPAHDGIGCRLVAAIGFREPSDELVPVPRRVGCRDFDLVALVQGDRGDCPVAAVQIIAQRICRDNPLPIGVYGDIRRDGIRPVEPIASRLRIVPSEEPIAVPRRISRERESVAVIDSRVRD